MLRGTSRILTKGLGVFYLPVDTGSLALFQLSYKDEFNRWGENPYGYNFFLQNNQVLVGASMNKAEFVLGPSPRKSDSSHGQLGSAKAPHWV